MHVRVRMKNLLERLLGMLLSRLLVQAIGKNCNSPVLENCEVASLMRIVLHTLGNLFPCLFNFGLPGRHRRQRNRRFRGPLFFK